MSWTKTQANGYDIYTTSVLTLADNAGDNAEYVTVTPAIPDGVNWEDTKFPVTCKMTVVTTDATTNVDMVLQTSVTGNTADDVIGSGSSATPSWFDSAAIDVSIATGVLANYTAECDASSVKAPYARFAIKTGADDLNGDAGRCTVAFAHKPSKPNNEGLAPGDFAGTIGKDPS
jgi:hypothetical protein